MSNIVNEELPNLHDAELYALCHDAKAGTLRCVFRKGDGQDAVLFLSGVTKFRCTDFGLQNVVLELIISSPAHQIRPEDLRTYVTWLSTTVDGELLAEPQDIEIAMHDVQDGTSQCVFLIPSWGAQLGAIATHVEWR